VTCSYRFRRRESLIENIATGETFEVENPDMDPLEVCALLVQVGHIQVLFPAAGRQISVAVKAPCTYSTVYMRYSRAKEKCTFLKKRCRVYGISYGKKQPNVYGGVHRMCNVYCTTRLTSPLQEDFALLLPDIKSKQYKLVSAAVTFPMRWSLPQKMNRRMNVIHGPVPFYQTVTPPPPGQCLI